MCSLEYLNCCFTIGAWNAYCVSWVTATLSKPLSSCSTCFPLTVFALLCFPVIGSWKNLEPQSLPILFREWLLTAPWHSNWLETRKSFDAWGILPTYVHISQEIVLALKKASYFILINNLPKYSSFVSMWKIQVFPITSEWGWDTDWVVCGFYKLDSSRNELLAYPWLEKLWPPFPVL